MKNLFYLAICAMLLSSCGQEGKKQNLVDGDSVSRIINQKDAEINNLLGTVNDIQDGLNQITEAQGRINALKQGMQMIMNEFSRAFEDLGVKEIEAVGKAFDPKLHDAVKSEASEEVPEGIVISQWKAGYKLGDRLIRPSSVVVSSGPAKEEEKKGEDQKG